MNDKTPALIYIGKGAFQAPYPARDLTADEVAKFGEQALLGTKLYQKPQAADKPTMTKAQPKKAWEKEQ
jgi:hypothetical protein